MAELKEFKGKNREAFRITNDPVYILPKNCMKTFEKENIFYNNNWLAPISRWFRTHFIAVYRLL